MPGIFDVVNDASLTSFVLFWFGQSVRTSGIWLFHKMLNKCKVVITYMRKYRALYVAFENSPSLCLFFWVKGHILYVDVTELFPVSKNVMLYLLQVGARIFVSLCSAIHMLTPP